MKRAPCESAASCTPAVAAHTSIAALLDVTPPPIGSEYPANRPSTPPANEEPQCSDSAPSGGRAPAASNRSIAADLGIAALLDVTPLPVHEGSASPLGVGAIARQLDCTPLAGPAAFSGGSERCSLQEVQERIRSPPLRLSVARPFSSQLNAESEIIAATMDLDARECAAEEVSGASLAYKDGATGSSDPDGDCEYSEDDNEEMSLAITSTGESVEDRNHDGSDDDDDDLEEEDRGNVHELGVSTAQGADLVAHCPAGMVKRTGCAGSQAVHLSKIRSGTVYSFRCECPLAKSRRSASCLSQFSMDELFQIHHSVYGGAAASKGNATLKTVVANHTHQLLWELKEPFTPSSTSVVVADETSTRPAYRIKTWKLLCKAVCRKAWLEAAGTTERMVRTVYSMVRCGISPVTASSSAAAKRTVALVDAAVGAAGRRFDHPNCRTHVPTPHIRGIRRGLSTPVLVCNVSRESMKRAFATAWWVRTLGTMDFMPNECRIVIRGPSYGFYHKRIYCLAARPLGLELSYKTWRACALEALRDLSKRLPGQVWDQQTGAMVATNPHKLVLARPVRELGMLKMGRAAKHSKFPECAKCARARKDYLEACQACSDPEEIESLLHAIMVHQAEWSEDRKRALELRRDAYLPEAADLYECDDKCGSFWCKLPVDPSGRHDKAAAKALYNFAVQANVVCGAQGVIRFAVVPKNIYTGGNFGLTNLIMGLFRAHEKGRLKPHVKRLLRHTDGGSDNVSHVTHIMHWLLVYLGIFDEVLWFRFEAGHSHTEIADRLFSLMKRLFESDTAARTGGCPSFSRLEEQLRETFADCPETFCLEYNFANWDFEKWFGEATDEHRSLFDGPFARYSFDNVFRYTYVGQPLAHHGGVKVTYKDRLSRKGTTTNCEFGPIETVSGPDGAERTQETADGILFVPRPPDLRREPPKEAFDTDDAAKMAKGCKAVLANRHASDLSKADRQSWLALQSFHESTPHAGAVPYMPHTVGPTDGRNTEPLTLTGSPCPLLPILKAMRRFPRPLITGDPFEDPPPPSFPLEPGHGEQPPGKQKARDAAKEAVRDPRKVNNVVHRGRSQGDVERDYMEMDNERWAEEAPTRLESVEVGGLYMVELHEDEPDGQYRLGLVQVLPRLAETPAGKERCKWFARTNAPGSTHPKHVWPQTGTKFHLWGSEDSLSIDMFRFGVSTEDFGPGHDLTDGSRDKWSTTPTLTARFVSRLSLFAKREGLGPLPLPAPPAKKAPAATAHAKEDATRPGGRQAESTGSKKRPPKAHHANKRCRSRR